MLPRRYAATDMSEVGRSTSVSRIDNIIILEHTSFSSLVSSMNEVAKIRERKCICANFETKTLDIIYFKAFKSPSNDSRISMFSISIVIVCARCTSAKILRGAFGHLTTPGRTRGLRRHVRCAVPNPSRHDELSCS